MQYKALSLGGLMCQGPSSTHTRLCAQLDAQTGAGGVPLGKAQAQ
jgi:hypothetical protein